MRWLKSTWPFFIVLLLPFVLYWKLFALSADERKIFRGDFLNQHYVWKSYTLERVKDGELPLWNPHVLGGVAFHANPQVGIFYPPTYLLLPFHDEGRVSYVALEAYQLLHQAMGGMGMLLFARALGLSNLAGLAAAIVFMFTGFFTTPGHHAIVLTASWIPWVLYFTKRAVQEASVAWIVPLALTMSLMLLAGHPQPAYYGLGLAGAWALLQGGICRSLLRFAPAVVLAIGVASVQLVPTYQLANESNRSDVGYEYSTTFELSPYFLSAAVAPRGQVRLAGQDGASALHLYVGIGTLLLAGAGLFLGRGRPRLFFFVAAVVALFLSFGQRSLLFDLFYSGLPGFKSFRIPYRLMGLYGLSMAVLAAMGVQALQRPNRWVRRRLAGLNKATLVVVVLVAAWAAYLHTNLIGSNALPAGQVERIVGAAYWAVLLGVVNLLLMVMIAWRPRASWALPLIVGVLVLDIGAFVKDRGWHPYSTLVRSGERPVHRLANAQGYRSRHVTDSNLESYSMLFRTDFAGGQDSLVDGRYAELLAASTTSSNLMSLLNTKFVVRRTPIAQYPWCGPRYASPLPILDVSAEIAPVRLSFPSPVEARNVRIYWSPLGPGGTGEIELNGERHPLGDGPPLDLQFNEPMPIEAFQVLVAPDNPGVRIEDMELDLNPVGLKTDYIDLDGIHLNLHALPRTYFMEPSSVPSEMQTVASLSCWTVHDGIQVIDPRTGEGAAGFFRKGATKLETYRPEEVVVVTDSPRDGYVVLADTFRPGWHAEVDGQPAAVLLAQMTQRAVAVPRGHHEVRFTYQPESLKLGASMSLLSFLLLGSLLVAPHVAARFRSEMEVPDDDFVTTDSIATRDEAQGTPSEDDAPPTAPTD